MGASFVNSSWRGSFLLPRASGSPSEAEAGAQQGEIVHGAPACFRVLHSHLILDYACSAIGPRMDRQKTSDLASISNSPSLRSPCRTRHPISIDTTHVYINELN